MIEAKLPQRDALLEACSVLMAAVEDIRQMAESRSRVNMADGISLGTFCRQTFVKIPTGVQTAINAYEIRH